MRKWIIAFSLLAALLGLAGCGQSAPTAHVQNTNLEEKLPVLLAYKNGVINSEGQIIFPPDSSNCAYQIWQDCEGRQLYVLAEERTYSDTLLDGYNEPLVIAKKFTVYENPGWRILKQVQAPGNQTNCQIFLDGNLDKSLVMVNLLKNEHKYQLLDMDGGLLVEKQLEPYAEVGQAYTSLCLADDFLAVNYYIYDLDYNCTSGVDVYDWQGQPLALVRDYKYIWRQSYWFSGDFFETKYYCATYQVTPDKELCDILDSQGQVLLSGLRDVNCVGPGLFLVEDGFSRGLMNDKGEWLYQESIFDGLED